MGYPIYSNIFGDNPESYEALRKFPIQVAVLYSPGDQSFSDAFREVFLELDQITGDDVVFFAVLDPPEDWLRVARNRPDWREYWERKTLGYTVNDRMLVDELANRFGILWPDLPALVISTNLWSTEFLVTKTSPDHIVSQLRALTELAQKRRMTDDIDHGYILESLQDKFGFPVQYQPPDEGRRRGVSQFYEILGTDTASGRDNSRRISQYWNDTFFGAIRATRSLATKLSELVRSQSAIDFQGVNSLLRTIAGQLVPFAAKNEKIRGTLTNQLFDDRFSSPIMNYVLDLQERNDILKALDDESITMINRSLRIGMFLNTPDALEPILLGKNRYVLEEYSPAGQGLWKAFEREINKSIVQAMRNARTIEMPQFFASYRPQFAGKNYIETPKKVDINRQDWEDPLGIRHRFLEMGVALRCVNALQGKPGEQFDQVVRRCLGSAPLPKDFLDDWDSIARLRNPPSHTELLSRDGFFEVANKVLKTRNLETLIRIKRTLSQ